MSKKMPKIFYPFAFSPKTGGDFVNIDHIKALRNWGLDAQIVFINGKEEGEKANFGDLPVVWGYKDSLHITPQDIFIMPEVLPTMMKAFQNPNDPISQARVIMHNQAALNSFESFPSVQAMNKHPIERIIVPSEASARRLQEIGICKPLDVVHPYIPEMFQPREKSRQPIKIVYSSSKRSREIGIVGFYFSSLYRAPYAVEWVDMNGISRQEVAALMSEAAIFLSFAQNESLGLMALEAMASGCHVVGFSGHAGGYCEFFNDENGDWINEGDFLGFAHKICEAIDLFIHNASNTKITAGYQTVKQHFRYIHFEQALKQVFEKILEYKIA